MPMPSISQRIRSPGSRKTGGSRKTPTPDGVPVAMMSPGSRVIERLMNAISAGTSPIRSLVEPSCMRCSVPSGVIRQLRRRRPALGSSSSRVTKAGPIGRNVSLALGAQPLAVALLAGLQGRRRALPVAGADVVDDDVAGDVVHGIGHGHATGPSDR